METLVTFNIISLSNIPKQDTNKYYVGWTSLNNKKETKRVETVEGTATFNEEFNFKFVQKDYIKFKIYIVRKFSNFSGQWKKKVDLLWSSKNEDIFSHDFIEYE